MDRTETPQAALQTRAVQIIKKAIRDNMVLSAPATSRAAEVIVQALAARGMLVDSEKGGEGAEAEDQKPEG